MSYLGYIYCNTLTKEEILRMDSEVRKNRKTLVYSFMSIVVSVQCFGPSVTVMLPLPPPPSIYRLQHMKKKGNEPSAAINIKTAVNIQPKTDRLTLEQVEILNDLEKGSITLDQAIEKLQKLRGGDWTEIAWFLIFLYALANETPVDAFLQFRQARQAPFHYMDLYGWLNGKYDSKGTLNRQSPSKSGYPRHGSTLEITRPSAMPQSDFDALSKVDKRRLSDSRDMKIKHEGYPELDVGFWQAEYKVRKHGAIHGLEYTIDKKGGTVTPKTEENALKMMKSIVDMPNRDQVEWYLNGTYQGGTNRQFEAIHIYDSDNGIIAVFDKSTHRFVTTCQLKENEVTELKATGNFGGGENWFSKEAKNLPPLQNFESDVMRITPINPMNTSPNSGFTPINSFESDVMGITPINPMNTSPNSDFTP